jgi:hypothetical protein
MARTIDFKRFATGPGANIEAQPTFNVDEALVSGVQAGTASSALANKVWRQSSFWSELLATFISQQLDIDQLDDNDLAAKLANFGVALSVYIQENVIFQKFMTGNLDFYVGGTGANNTNPGTSLAPWATLQHAVTEISKYNTNGFTLTVHCQGPFSAGMSIPAIAGPGQVVFSFAAGSSITVSTGACITIGSGANVTIDGPVTFSAPMAVPITGFDGVAIYAFSAATVILSGGALYSACSGSHIVADSSSTIVINGNYTIQGNSASHWKANAGGLISVANNGLPITISIIGTPSFSNAFAIAQSLAIVRALSTTIAFAGSTTGQRYNVSENAIIKTAGGGASFIPGTVAGAASTGGQYT